MGAEGKVDFQEIVTRPNASPGFWLCTLIPMAYLVTGFRYPHSSSTFIYKMTFLTALGLNLQSTTFFLHLNSNSSRIFRFVYAFLPGIVTSILFFTGLHQKILVSAFWGFLFPLVYQFFYIKTLMVLPRSFTYGEASIVVQGLTLFILNAVLQIPSFTKEHPTTDFSEMNAIMITALFCLAVTICLIYAVPIFKTVYLFYPLLVILVTTVCLIPVTHKPPVVTLIGFILADLRRVFLIVFYLGMVGLSVSTVSWQLSRSCKASASVRKIFHLLVVCVFVPGLIYQCTLMYISTGVALAFLVVLETLRILEIPPFAEVLKSSVQRFVDDKDAGKVTLTPFYLLIGCSMPLWISPNPCSLADTASDNLIPMLAGVISIGVGDTIAAVIGSNFGKHKIPGSHKSIEGLVAAIALQTLTVYIIYFIGIIHLGSPQLIATSSAILITSILEAITDQVDNLVLPLVFYIISSLA